MPLKITVSCVNALVSKHCLKHAGKAMLPSPTQLDSNYKHALMLACHAGVF